MEISVWSPDWGVASVDFECLTMISYAKFSGAPVSIKASNSPFWSSTGHLPVFRTNDDTHEASKHIRITDFKEFISYLRKKKFSADYNLSPKQQSEVAAFSQLMEEKLKPALLYAFWIDAKNLTELTRPWYAKKLGVPQCFYYPGKYATHAAAVIESRVGVDADDVHRPDVEASIYRDAQECLTILSRRLGDSDPYFFGKAPSSADAIMYGYLAPLLKAPLPNPTPLQAHLKACGNLVSFVSRISHNYFPQVSIDYEKLLREDNSANVKSENNKHSDSGEVIPAKPLSEKLRPVMVSSFAVAAMLGYAHLSGLSGIVKDINLYDLLPSIMPENKESDEND